MKKLIIIVLCVAIAAVGAFVFLKQQERGSAIENILPKGPLAYVQLNDVEKNLRKMSSIPFWKTIGSINYDVLIQKNVIGPQHKMLLDLIRTQFSQVLSHPMTKKLFGQQVALAIYPLDKDVDALVKDMKTFDPMIIEELLSGLFLVTRVDPDVQLAEFLSRAFSKYGDNVSQGQVEYKGETIRTITIANVGVKFSFVRLKDVLVFGIGEKATRMSIDAYKGSKPSLAEDPQLAEALLTARDPSSMVGFFDFAVLLKTLRDQSENLSGLAGEGSESDKVQERWNDVLSKMSGLKTFAFSSGLEPIMRFNARFLTEPAKLDPEYASLYTCPSQTNKTIKFVPEAVLGYQWSNCFDLNYYWKELKKEMEQTDEAQARVNDLQAKIGLSIEDDILPVFGDEIGGYLSDIQVGGFFPIPKFVFFIEIKNKGKAEQLLSKLKDQPMAMLQQEDYNGVEMKYLALPFGEDIQPGYCFLGDYLMISSSRQLLKSSVDASGNAAKSLLASPAFKKVNYGLTDKSRSVQFVRVGAIVEKIKGVVGWTSDWVSAQERKAQAFQVGSTMPLEEVKNNIIVRSKELEEMSDRIIVLEDEVWNLETKGEDFVGVQTQINDLKGQIRSKELELSGEYERQQELENILQKGDQNTPDLALRQLYLDEAIYPILDSLRSIKSYGMRVTFEKNALEASAFFDVSY